MLKKTALNSLDYISKKLKFLQYDNPL